MAMYKCDSCGHLFEEGEEKVLIEQYEHFGTPCEKEFSVCPVCGGDYTEVEPCKICDEYTDTKNEGLCEDCKMEAIFKFNSVWDEFEDVERKFLVELINEGGLI